MLYLCSSNLWTMCKSCKCKMKLNGPENQIMNWEMKWFLQTHGIVFCFEKCSYLLWEKIVLLLIWGNIIKVETILLGDKNATSLYSKNISTLLT